MKKLVVFFVAIFFFQYSLAQADVIISEIKYSPTAKQWLEVYNDTDNDINITKYKILDSSVKIGHKISAVGSGSNSVPKHSFGVIAKVPSDFSAVSFPIFKSSLNIKVSGDKVILKNDLGENISSVNIDGSAVDGKSLQLINGAWVSATPTAGGENKLSLSGPKPNQVFAQNKTVRQDLTVEENKVVRQDLTTIAQDLPNPIVNIPKANNKLYIFVTSLILLLLLSAKMVYLIRKKHFTPNIGDDFDILEE